MNNYEQQYQYQSSPLSMLAKASALINEAVESLVSRGVRKHRLSTMKTMTKTRVIISGMITYGENLVQDDILENLLYIYIYIYKLMIANNKVVIKNRINTQTININIQQKNRNNSYYLTYYNRVQLLNLFPSPLLLQLIMISNHREFSKKIRLTKIKALNSQPSLAVPMTLPIKGDSKRKQKNKNVIFCTKFIAFQVEIEKSRKNSKHSNISDKENDEEIIRKYYEQRNAQTQGTKKNSRVQEKLEHMENQKQNLKKYNNQVKIANQICYITNFNSNLDNFQDRTEVPRFHRECFTSRTSRPHKTFKSFVCENMSGAWSPNYRRQKSTRQKQKDVKFNNKILSSSLKKVSHSAKISKCLTLGQLDSFDCPYKKINQYSGIEITGFKAPKIQVVDHFRLKTAVQDKQKSRQQQSYNFYKDKQKQNRKNNSIQKHKRKSKIL